MKNRSSILSRILVLTIFCSILSACATQVEQAPRKEQNTLLKICTNLLLHTNQSLSQDGEKLPKQVKQRVRSLLASAEISNQFEQYPDCVDKLERTRYFLGQANIMISKPTF